MLTRNLQEIEDFVAKKLGTLPQKAGTCRVSKFVKDQLELAQSCAASKNVEERAFWLGHVSAYAALLSLLDACIKAGDLAESLQAGQKSDDDTL